MQILLDKGVTLPYITVMAAPDSFCLICGGYRDQPTMLCPHHIIPVGARAQAERLFGDYDDPRNIMTVCKHCHIKIHNGLIDVLEVLKQYKGIDIFRWEILVNYLEDKCK